MNYIGDIPNKKYWEPNEYKLYINSNKSIIYNLKNEAIKYCERDVIIVKNIIENIFKIIDEKFKKQRISSLSSPSISHKIFFSNFNKFNIDINLNLEDECYIRPSFFGGRCEVFGNISSDDEIIKYYDFSGMYGQCMLEEFHLGKSIYDTPKIINKPGFYNITYYSNFEFLPILPCKHNEKLYFANGYNTGTFWYEEILMFEKYGGKVLKINSAIVYEKKEKVFYDFIQEFNKIREKKGYYKFFGKLMINSLYGSMALKDKDTYQFITFSEEEFYNIVMNNSIEDYFKINNCYIIIIKIDFKSKHFIKNLKIKPDKTKRNVSYAAAISSKARIKLYERLQEVLKNEGKLLYCDTDSIYASYDKKKKYEKISFEWLKEYSDGVFISPKTYSITNEKETIIKIKGISNKEISINSLKKKFYENSSIIFDEQLSFLKHNFNLRQIYLKKEISLADYDKRLFEKNKKITKPIIINNNSNYVSTTSL